MSRRTFQDGLESAAKVCDELFDRLVACNPHLSRSGIWQVWECAKLIRALKNAAPTKSAVPPTRVAK